MTIIREWNDPYQWQNWILTLQQCLVSRTNRCHVYQTSTVVTTYFNKKSAAFYFISRPIIIMRVDINQVYRSHFERLL